MTSVLLRLAREHSGAGAVDEILRQADTTHGAEFLSHADNWISLDEAISLLETAQRVTGDDQLARRTGGQAVEQHAGTQVATLLRSLGTPEASLGQIAMTAGRFSTVTDLVATLSEPGRVMIEARARPGVVRHALHYQWTSGLISAAPRLFGLPPGDVVESECQATGGQCCRYTVTWDAELAAENADPAKRVTQLEGQLIAITERLHSVYATARDLLSPDELDVVLPRILERAATAVRAPRFVLAVRTGPENEPHVYCDGIDELGARRVIAAVERSAITDSMAVAPVASARRTYGHLIALNPEGTRFFDQEHELLELYAQQAAAVLDMAMALAESDRRHREVSALLALSESLTQAESSADVAARLADAIPTIVDCDFVAVYGLDSQSALVPIVAHRVTGSTSEPVTGTRMPIRNPATIERFASGRRPLFFDRGTENDLAAARMVEMGLEASTVVPIVVRDEPLGAIIIGVDHEPERLAQTEELLERLIGVAALAAPPLHNGRLMDELRHRAAHDPLTGLYNRAGFHDHIGETIAGATGNVGLLFVDLDGFKQINDTHGHHVGDELLRLTALRLAELVRSGDATARLGGDEFALILSAVESPEELDAAAQRVRDAFIEPFAIDGLSVSVSASVGSAISTPDGEDVQELMRRADVAMYDNKLAARG